MSLAAHHLELLAPARTADIGIQAILHGADAVYIGGPSFGARSAASNSVSDIARLVEFAQRYHARIFVTFNTILHDDELEPGRRLIHELYDAGVDALIIQDMGILEMDLPPIELHASTQCDIRTVEKAEFLAASGFSQLVLARELTLQQIAAIKQKVDVPLEFFVHGALCVAFSGQCYISHAHTGRSANRGDCSQACRLPYNLLDSSGAVVAFDRHLLSMKDNDQSANLAALVEAGIRSFKIEGRYKDQAYVKNITGHYRRLIDDLLTQRPDLARASSGRTELLFTPDPDRNFHRGKTDYFVNGRQGEIGAFESPKHLGLPVGEVAAVGDAHFDLRTSETLHNGDGLNFMRKREVAGLQADVVKQLKDGLWRVYPNDPDLHLQGLKPGLPVHRNRDHAWDQMLEKTSAHRFVGLQMRLQDLPDAAGLLLTLTDTDGYIASATHAAQLQAARDTDKARQQARDQLTRIGNTEFECTGFEDATSQAWFVPASQLNALRREAVAALQTVRLEAARQHRGTRLAEKQPPAVYPETHLTYLANVYNHLARQFYARHGVTLIDDAYEANTEDAEVPVMITKHCLRFSFNLFPKQAKGVQGVQGQVKAEPMVLQNGKEKLTLKFDCKPCEMHVMGSMRKSILASPPPGSGLPAEAPIRFMPRKVVDPVK